MAKKIFTYEYEEKGLGVIEIDYDLSIFIHEIRVWSDYFEAFIPVSQQWLENNFPVRLKSLRNKLYVAAHEQAQPRPKEYNNDDPDFVA